MAQERQGSDEIYCLVTKKGIKTYMKALELVRINTDETHGTFGTLTVEGNPLCLTLEPFDNGNQRGISCIPEGEYTCERYSSVNYPDTFEVKDVEGRSYILFHTGNTIQDSQGCILLGTSFGELGAYNAILQSKVAFFKFLEAMEDEDLFTLTIKNSYTKEGNHE
jgi:hypothetical protein